MNEIHISSYYSIKRSITKNIFYSFLAVQKVLIPWEFEAGLGRKVGGSSGLKRCIGNGKIHHYPLERALKLRKLLCVNKERFKGLREDLIKYQFDIEKAVKKKEFKEPLIDEKQSPIPLLGLSLPQAEKLIIDDDRYSSIYIPEALGWAQDKPSWQWKRVNEWFELMAEYNCVIAKEGEPIEKLRATP